MTNLDAPRQEPSPFIARADAAPGAALLVVEHPASVRGMTLSLQSGGSVIGRDAELILPDSTLSRRHARAWWHGATWWVEDCGSKNGTLVNGQRIESPVPVRVGDRVTFGAVECRLVLAGQEQIPPQSPVSQHEPVRSSFPTQPISPAQTETTRYLCAATHLDEEFGQQVIRHTLDQSYRTVAPSPGVNVATVARHALAARRRRFVRDLLLLVVLLGAVLMLASHLTRPENLTTFRAMDATTVRLLISALPLKLLVFGALAGLVVTGESWITRYLVLSRQLSNQQFQPNAISAPMRRRARERLTRLAAGEHGNVTIFRGFHPFIGSGLMVNHWSFAVDIAKGCLDSKTGKRRTPQGFNAAMLHEYLGHALRSLAMPGLVVTHRLFVNGSDVWQDPRLLPNRQSAPVIAVPHAVVQEMLCEKNPIARPYLCAQVTGWHGQLVQTTFFRAVKHRDSLYVEGAAFMLLPLRSQFYAVDSLVPCGPLEAVIDSLSRAAVRSLPLLLASPTRVLRAVSTMTRASRAEERQRRIISNGWHFDYGAATSIREIAAGLDTRRYFLEADGDMFETVVQERLLRAAVDFLSEHDIDIDQVKNFQQTINNGNIFNGNVDFGNSKNASISGKTTNTNNTPSSAATAH